MSNTWVRPKAHNPLGLTPLAYSLYTHSLFRFPERAYSPLHILIPALMT